MFPTLTDQRSSFTAQWCGACTASAWRLTLFDRPLIAIDIGTSAVKMVEMSGRGSKQLRAIGLEMLPTGAVVDGTIQDVDSVGRVIKELLRKLKISATGRRAALAVSGSNVIVKRVAVDIAKGTEIGEQVFYEAEQHFQHDMSDLYFDYHEIKNAPNQDGKKPLILVGAKREMVENHIASIRNAGLRAGVVDAEVFSINNMFEYNYGRSEGLIVLINIGASSTQVSLIAQGVYLYTRDISIGGQDYTRQIMEVMGVERDNAESLKISASMGDASTPPEVQKALAATNDQLVAEIRTTIDYFFSSGEAAPDLGSLTGAFLSGGGSRILGLDAALAYNLGVHVKTINPFYRVEINPKRFQMDYLLMQGHLYGVAVGLAMRSVNDRE